MDNIKILPKYRVDKTNKEIISKKRKNNNRKTTEQYKEELKSINPNIDVSGEYMNAHTSILHNCKICNYIWSASPSNILRGKSCPQCSKVKRRNPKEYEDDVLKINPNIIVLEDFINSTTKIKHQCKICEYIWFTQPSNILQGRGCPNCANKNRNKNRQPTQGKYYNMLHEKNYKLEVIGTYVNMNTKIEHICLFCNDIILITPDHALRGYGCKKCSSISIGQKLKLTKEQFAENVYKRNPNIELLSNYIGNNKPITCKCKICHNIWTVKYPFQLYASNCPQCIAKKKGKKMRLTTDEFLSKITPNIILLSKYIDSNSPIDCKCKSCGHLWTVNQASSLRYVGCPNCRKSKGEQLIKNILDNNQIKYIPQKTFSGLIGTGGGLLLYDFYLEKYNLLIEYQGEQHCKSVNYFGGEPQFKKQQEHDRRKREYAKQNNINLLEIWYYDINNIESILLQKINELQENNLKLESVETAISA